MADTRRGWRRLETQGISWINLAAGVLLLAVSPLDGTGGATFWSAFATGLTVVFLETFDEWAEHHDLETEVVGPSSVVALAGAWLVGFPFFVETSAFYQVATTLLGVVLLTLGTVNMVLSARLEERPPRRPLY